MGLLQPSFGTTLTIKNYSGGGGTEKTIEEIITLMKAINSNFNIFYFDPYNYPYIVGGAVCPTDTTDIYMINEEKYTQYTNMVGIRGEKNGASVNVIPYNSMSPMYQYNQYGNAMISAGVAHNFTGATFDGNSYSIAYGNYQNDFIFVTTLNCNIYINNELSTNWENITVKLNHNITQATILDLTAATSDKECSYNSNTLFTPETDFRDFVISGTAYNQDMIFADDELMLYKKNGSYIQCYSYYHDPSNYGGGWSIYYQGETIGGFDGNMLGKYDKYYGVAFLIDEVNQNGQILACYSYYPNTSWNQKHYTKRLITNSNKLHKAYLLIKEILTGAKIKVNYYLPDYEYTYAKITYKQDSEPDSETDGESVEILKDETSVNIEGLEEEKTYYFKIFTDKSESEAFPYTVEVDPVPPEYKTYIDNINGTGFDWIRELEQDTATITNSDRSTFTADMYKYYPMNKVTWYTHSHQGTDVEYWNKTTFAGQTTALFVSSKIDKVEINSNNNVYSCTITKNNENSVTSPDRMFVYEKNVTMGGVYTKDTLPRGWYANFNYHSGYLAYGPSCNPFYLAGSWATRTFSGTLTEVFEQLQRYVRNIDIYVDGVLWSKAGK